MQAMHYKNKHLWLACLVAAVLVSAFPAAEASGSQGYIYGRVTTESGSEFEGRIRWSEEEAFWGDLFNSIKRERPTPRDDSDATHAKRERIKIFGVTVGVSWSESNRVFKARFGDIREIRPGRGERAVVVMKSGTEVEIDGGSNDIGGKLQIWDDGLGQVEVEWERIERIEFLPVPKGLDVDDTRLHGTVQTTQGGFTGYIQWDQDECQGSDKLDGNTRDADLSLAMHRIRAIERLSKRRALVVLVDGRELELEGTNDVNSENRGIFVEDDRYGRVLIPWDVFERVDFSDAGSGPAFDRYASGPLRGAVTDRDGNVLRGRLSYDLDEAETWEFFDGNRNDIEYSIPLGLIAAITPTGGESATVKLRSGEELELEGTADTGQGHAGVLVIGEGGSESYVPWDEVRRVELER